MSFTSRLRDAYLRIDARSLGLFRIAMGAALVGDWWVRWGDLRAFYSNEGALQNHVHLNNLARAESPERVWSVLHAFSTPGEARVGFLVILLFYFFFLIGFKTRWFHVLSLVALVSFTGRNLYLEGPANFVAIALLAATAFLPCGSRFSIDSLRASFRRNDEKDATSLNDRSAPSEALLAAERSPGWTPTSIAALAVLLQLTVILVATSRQQSGGQWQSGTALHYALWVERWVSDLGMLVRRAPPGLLRVWSQILRYSPLAVPVLIFVPAPRYARPAAFGLLLFYGLSYGLLFSFGLWGWALAAASFLLISTETWEAWQSRHAKGRALTVIYDADCGICLWLTRLLQRFDLRSHLTFQGNDLLNVPPAPPGEKAPYRSAAEPDAPRVLYRRSAPGAAVETAPLPAAVTDDLVTGTVVAVDGKGQVLTEGRAIAAIVRSLPLGGLLSLPLRIPGTAGLWDALYRLVPPRRFAISESLGLGACGVPPAGGELAPEEANPLDIPPAVKLRRLVTGALREGGAALLFLAALAQTARSNPWPAPLTVPQNNLFAAVTGWSRMLARYDVIAPEAPVEDGVFVVDGQTRDGRSVDPLTGKEPSLEKVQFRMDLLWGQYTVKMREKVPAEVEKSFRDYLVKGGPEWSTEGNDAQITGLDAYWLVYKSPAPGGSSLEITGREKLFTHQRGGRLNPSAIPLIKPILR